MIVLASNSPRRKQLLAKLTADFVVVPSRCAEVTTAALPKDAAKELACHKAFDVFKHLPSDEQYGAVVVGCDTVVELDGKVLGKPSDEQHAKQMLAALSGRTHFVHTGYAVYSDNAIYLGVATTEVTFRTLSADEIADYVASGAALDKAGAYGIQETDFAVVVYGSYDNVVGFPTEKIADILRNFGVLRA